MSAVRPPRPSFCQCQLRVTSDLDTSEVGAPLHKGRRQMTTTDWIKDSIAGLAPFVLAYAVLSLGG